jgi:hypothetical protein
LPFATNGDTWVEARAREAVKERDSTAAKLDAALFPEARPPPITTQVQSLGGVTAAVIGAFCELRAQPRDPRDGEALGRTARPDRSRRLGIRRPTGNGDTASDSAWQRGHSEISAKVFVRVRACPSSTPAPWMPSSKLTSADATNAQKGNTATTPAPPRVVTTEQEGETETNGGFQPLQPKQDPPS